MSKKIIFKKLVDEMVEMFIDISLELIRDNDVFMNLNCEEVVKMLIKWIIWKLVKKIIWMIVKKIWMFVKERREYKNSSDR